MESVAILRWEKPVILPFIAKQFAATVFIRLWYDTAGHRTLDPRNGSRHYATELGVDRTDTIPFVTFVMVHLATTGCTIL